MEAGGSVQRILERLGGLERHGGAGGNFHRLASAWVAPGPDFLTPVRSAMESISSFLVVMVVSFRVTQWQERPAGG